MKGLYAEPMGVDFSSALAWGLRQKLTGQPPEAMARVTLLTNTSRMARRAEAALAQGGATLLPRIGLVANLARLLPPGAMPDPDIGALGVRLRLTRLVDGLLRQRPDLSPRSAAFDLAGTLQALLDEMQEEAMDAEALARVDVASLSDHWQQSLAFLTLVANWQKAEGAQTNAAIQRLALDRVIGDWQKAPPTDPVIIAGSTASRAPTRRLIKAVLDLPQGVVILPGMDRDMPDAAWDALTDQDGTGVQDHPQYRHAALLRDLGLTRDDVPRWSERQSAVPARNRLISLALRPAPATDAWRSEGPALTEIDRACEGITLLRAPDPAAEASAIALGLRAALADGKRAALITPDRTLSRMVAAQLDRWSIVPDDSAGAPLSQTAPGRFLLHLAEMRGRPVEAEPLMILLSHPATAEGGDRRTHLDHLRQVELELIRKRPLAFPDRAALETWLAHPKTRMTANAWTDWLGRVLDALASAPDTAPLFAHLANLRDLTELLVSGPDGTPDTIWSDAAGRMAKAVLATLEEAADNRGDDPIMAADFTRILSALLVAEEVRETFSPHPEVMIWGALEARVRSADLVILGGLTDDTWPGQPAPDPWLNRTMRKTLGLRLPDRQIGLSAHDFQQAASGAEIWLSRALRNAEAETVPSRWLNRIEGLLGGIGTAGAEALEQMTDRGQDWLDLAARLATPDDRHPATKAPRPAVVLPPDVRLRELSVTGVETLIRDPYAVYARSILKLYALAPLRQGPDARLRGEAIHVAMDRFTRAFPEDLPADAAAQLRRILSDTLEELAPWPGSRRLWLGKFDRAADAFLMAEAERRALGRPRHVEGKGAMTFANPPFTLTARADRIDDRGQAVAIFDYKTGMNPSKGQMKHFAKQLMLEAMMVEDGAFPDIGRRPVEEVAYLTVGSKYDARSPDGFGPDLIAATRDDFVRLVRQYADGHPFVARLAPDWILYASDYDQLSRRGEWADTDSAVPVEVHR